MTVPVLRPKVRWWHCPACELRDRTENANPHTQFHNCPGLNGLAVPLVEVTGPDIDADARHVVVMRDDYARDQDPRAAVRTDRGDGSNDITVLAPTATAGVES